MTFIWTVLAFLVLFAGIRYRQRLDVRGGNSDTPPVDDEAINRIIEQGTLSRTAEDEDLDLDAAAEAEEEFWDEYWDEPDEYQG